jgi:TonB family protein
LPFLRKSADPRFLFRLILLLLLFPFFSPFFSLFAMFFLALLAFSLLATAFFWISAALSLALTNKKSSFYWGHLWDRYENFLNRNLRKILIGSLLMSFGLTACYFLKEPIFNAFDSASYSQRPVCVEPIVGTVAIETSAMPQGGWVNYHHFITTTLKQSPYYQHFKGSEQTYVEFNVLSDGTCGEAEIIGGSGNPIFDKEALRVVALQPFWIPARSEGRPTEQRVTVVVDLR